MANKSRATFAKRQREIARQERAREKSARRIERKDGKVRIDRAAADVDPDIAGIVPGPQPLPYELLDEDVQEDEASEEKQ